MEPIIGMVLLAGMVLFIVGLMSSYRKRWETTWNGHHIAVVNRVAREELWIDGELVHRNDSHGFAIQAVLNGSVDDPELGPVPVRARIHMDNGASVGCELLINGVPVPLDGEHSALPLQEEQQQPSDPRWEAAAKLLARVRDESAAGDERLVAVSSEVQRALRRTLLALEHLDEAEQAHEVLGGDSTPLVEVRHRWEHRADELVGAVRELHLAVVSRDSPGGGSTVSSVEELLVRLSAEAEVDAASLADPEVLATAGPLPVEEPAVATATRAGGRREQTHQ